MVKDVKSLPNYIAYYTKGLSDNIIFCVSLVAWSYQARSKKIFEIANIVKKEYPKST
jgi:hypothetical protein